MMLERALASIEKAEAAYELTMEEAAGIVDIDGDDGRAEAEEASEEAALDTFNEKVEEVRDLADEMIILKQGLEDFRNDVEALQDSISSEPEKKHGAALARADAAFSELRKLINKSRVKPDHHLRQELKCFSILSCKLSTKTESSSTTFIASAPAPARTKMVQLPKIHLPKFDGDLMNWSMFWSQFQVAVDSNPDLTEEHKLAYLRDTVQDQDTRHLMFSRAEREGLYSEVIATLKKRFDKTREIHRNYCQALTQIGSVKSTKADLRKFIDSVRHSIAGLKHTGQYDVESFLTSMLYSCISRPLQVEWEVQSKATKGIPPVEDFLEFVAFHADVLSSQPPQPNKAPEHKPEKRQERKQERKPE